MITSSADLISNIRKMLLKRTKSKRIPHVMGVEGMSVLLAHRWGIDLNKTLIASLLHDLAKCLTLEEQRKKLEACTVIPATDEDYQFRNVWHGKVAAKEAHDLFGIIDHDILEAVAHHSTGAGNMSDVALALYIADFIEPSRKWDGAEECRKQVFSLKKMEAARTVAELKLEHLAQKNAKPHSQTHEMLAWLRSQVAPSSKTA